MTIGIDPGNASGVLCLLDGDNITVVNMPKTVTGIMSVIRGFVNDSKDPVTGAHRISAVAIEKVGCFPKEGAMSCFNFGKNAGIVEACVVGHRLRYVLPTPRTWKKELGVPVKGTKTKPEHKKLIKSKAQALYPNSEFGVRHADAIMLAHYARLWYNKQVESRDEQGKSES